MKMRSALALSGLVLAAVMPSVAGERRRRIRAAAEFRRTHPRPKGAK